MNVVIIEDEIKAAIELKSLVEQIGTDIRVSALLRSVQEALEWFSKNEMPDLILSDIHLGDGLSFDIYNAIEVSCPVVFCTAYDEYALKAFQHNGVDYLLKPIEQSDLLQCFTKLKLFGESLGPQADPQAEALKKNAYLSAILVYYRDRIIPINTNSIDFINTENNVVFVNTAQKKYEIPEILDKLILQLNPQFFFRANRQFIISRKSILKIEHHFARKIAVTLNTAKTEVVMVSKAKASSFLKWLVNGNSPEQK